MSTSHLAFAWLCCVLVVSIQAVPQGRIVGGSEAVKDKFPYQVSVRKHDVHVCGGSIISRNYILTAAHCVVRQQNGQTQRSKPSEVNVQAGSIDRTKGGVVVPVAAITVHEKYGFNMNDVALLKLANPLTFSAAIQAIPLSTVDKRPGEKLVISGWGRLHTEGERPNLLQWVAVNTISDKDCDRRVQISSERLICVDHPQGVGPCKGDSGGPAVYKGKLVGVASLILKNCGTNKPDIYANVFYYLPWIKQHSDVKA